MIREIEMMLPFSQITALGTTPPHYKSVEFISSRKILRPGLVGRLQKMCYRSLFRGKRCPWILSDVRQRIRTVLLEKKPHIVIAHDPEWLPYLVKLKNGFKLIYNAHEYHPLELNDDADWMRNKGIYYHNIYKQCLNKVDILINVCDSIARKCKEEYNKNSLVIPNAAFYHPHLISGKIGKDKPIRIIHHGVAIPSRQIECMIETVKMLGEGYQFDLMLVPGNADYLNQLKGSIANETNIRVIEPVSFDEIVPFINQYDIGIYNLPSESYNEKVALPNKVFEFIQARLCLVVSPNVEMARLVKKYDIGVVAESFEPKAFYEAIRGLDRATIERYKQNADFAAVEESAEKYYSLYLKVINEARQPVASVALATGWRGEFSASESRER